VIGGNPGISITLTPGGGPPSIGGTSGGGGAALTLVSPGSTRGGRYSGGGGGAIPVLVLIVMIELGKAWPVGLVPTTEPFDAVEFTGDGCSDT
jgi:hypothetical protein